MVGICVPRAPERVIGLLAVLKAGGAFLPLDPEHPPQRLSAMLNDSAASLVLVQPELAAKFQDFDGKMHLLEAEAPETTGLPDRNPAIPVFADSLAYVLFTSGSTGRPKGVGISHRSIHNRLMWMQERFQLDDSDAVLQKTPYTFDVSVWEFFWPLLAGARLILTAPGEHREPDRLVEAIARHRVTTLHFVPSMLNAFLEAVDIRRCPSLRRVICSGEALSADVKERFFEASNAELHNLYGPTEAAIDVTAWACQTDPANSTVPIGRPIANTQIYLLDECLNPVPVGVTGELYIGGVQLARGYLNRPDSTAERFVPNPFLNPPLPAGEGRGEGSRLYRTGDLARWRLDGTVEYLGRIDHQVKIRGFRIELGEIEARLKQHPEVMDAVVLAREDSPGDRRLVAYSISASKKEGPGEDETLSSDQLRAFLGEMFPDYMIPGAFVFLDRLPLTANGKLDRKALPTPELGQAIAERYEAPRNSTETVLGGVLNYN